MHATLLSAVKVFPTFLLPGTEKLDYLIGHAMANEKEMEKEVTHAISSAPFTSFCFLPWQSWMELPSA